MTNAFATWPCYTEEEAQAVSAVLLSNKVNYWTGEICRSFEREFAAWSHSEHAIAVANGTVALDLALHGLGIGRSNGGDAADEVVVTPRTFIASVSTVVNAGAVPVFADVERDSGNLSAETIEPVLSKRTRAIIVVHLAGWPAEMDPIMRLAERRGIKVIEDCAQAHGALYRGCSVGSIGHVGAWSFCQDKIMTTGGEGGMVTTADRELWSRMWSFKDHGKAWDAVYNRKHQPGFRFVHESFGTNWRMIEMQAAIGRIQLGRMAEWTGRRTEYALSIVDALRRHAKVLRTPLPGNDVTHAFYRLSAYVRPEALAEGWDRDRIVSELTEFGVPVMQGTCSEVYLEKAFDGTPWRPARRLAAARELGETSLTFLINPNLTAANAARVAQGIDQILSRAAV